MNQRAFIQILHGYGYDLIQISKPRLSVRDWFTLLRHPRAFWRRLRDGPTLTVRPHNPTLMMERFSEIPDITYTPGDYRVSLELDDPHTPLGTIDEQSAVAAIRHHHNAFVMDLLLIGRRLRG